MKNGLYYRTGKARNPMPKNDRERIEKAIQEIKNIKKEKGNDK